MDEKTQEQEQEQEQAADVDDIRAEEQRMIDELDILQAKARVFEGIGKEVRDELVARIDDDIQDKRVNCGTRGLSKENTDADRGAIEYAQSIKLVIRGLAWAEEIEAATAALDEFWAENALFLQDGGEAVISISFSAGSLVPADDNPLLHGLLDAGFQRHSWKNGSMSFSGSDTPENRILAEKMVEAYPAAEARYQTVPTPSEPAEAPAIEPAPEEVKA